MASTEIFRFMNVRKPRANLVFDLDDVIGVTPFQKELQQLSEAPDADVEAIENLINKLRILSDEEIKAISLNAAGPETSTSPTSDTRHSSVQDDAASERALQAQSLADMLLALRVKRLLNSNDSKPDERESQIEEILRTYATQESKGSGQGFRTKPLKISIPMALIKRAVANKVARDFKRPPVSNPVQFSEILAYANARGTALESLQRGVFDSLRVPQNLASEPQDGASEASIAYFAIPGVFGRISSWLFGKSNRPTDTQSPKQPQPQFDVNAATENLQLHLSQEARREAERLFGSESQLLQIAAVAPTQFLDQIRTAELELSRSVAAAYSGPTVVMHSNEHIPLPSPKIFRFTPGVRVAGIGELFVVLERHKRYEAEEVAHVENILPYEERLREHRSSRMTETLFERETTEEQEREEDLRTSERFELRNEAERTITETFSVEGGVDVTAKFGFISGEITIDTEFHIGYNRGVTETQRQGSEFAQEVVQHSLDKLRTAVRELRRATVRESVDEVNRHSFKGLKVPFSGVYRWVNKIQEVELRRYGQRVMIECFVPEPSARLLGLPTAVAEKLPEPPALNITPADITQSSYQALGAKYGATDLVPPPPVFRTIEYAWHATPPAGSNEIKYGRELPWLAVHSKEALPIPTDYAPVSVGALYTGRYWNDVVDVWVSVAGTVIPRLRGTPKILILTPVTNPHVRNGSVALGIRVWGNGIPIWKENSGAVITVVIVCERQSTALEAWQQQTFDKLLTASRMQWSEYHGALAAQVAAQGTVISGRNPAENRELQRDELKRWSIELMRKMPFDLNSVVVSSSDIVVDSTTVDSNRDITLFFERAFEWAQMSYWLYPYFWGRSSEHKARLQLVDTDPLHQTFLRAGAARVLIPVTPGYEERVLNYLESFAPEPEKVVWEAELDAYDTNATPLPPISPYPEMWMEVVTAKKRDLAYGTGTLRVTGGSDEVIVNDDSRWVPEEADIGREIFINGERHWFTELVAGQTARFRIDRAYARADHAHARYLIGSAAAGAPWEITIPTNLVILSDQLDKLNAGASVNTIDEANVVGDV